MATAKGTGTGGDYPQRQPSRWKRNIVVLLAVVLVAALAFAWSSLRREALASAAFAARISCACHYISGQPLDQCRQETALAGLGRTAGMVSLADDAPTRTVTASVALLASQKATYAPATGCQLERWKD